MPLIQGSQQQLPQNQLFDYLKEQYQQQPQGGGFEGIRNEEMRKFSQDILPGIQQKVASSGLGGQHSSANFMGPQQAGMDLSTRLAGLRDQYENRQQQRNLDRLGGLSNLYGGQQTYQLGRARQRQVGAQSRADLLSSLFSKLGGEEQQGQGNRFDELNKFYNLSQPSTENLLHDPKGGFMEGLSQTTPELAKQLMKLIGEYVGKNNTQAPTS